MNLREATVLIRLYEACQDDKLRRWAITQVPELGDIVIVPPLREEEPKRYHLLAYDPARPSYPLGSKVVVCWPNNINAICRAYAHTFDLVNGVEVKAEVL